MKLAYPQIKKINTVISIYLTLSITLFLSACTSIPLAEPDPLGLNGLWKSNCYYDKEFNEYFIDEYRFSGHSFVVYFESYDNENCQLPMNENGGLKAEFTLGKRFITPRGNEVIELDSKPVYETDEHIFKDIIFIGEDSFHWGKLIDNDTRPLVVDFDKTYRRK